MSRRLEVSIDRFPIAGTFAISRGSRTEIVIVTATISDGAAVGRGECVPYPRYGESVEGVAAAIRAASGFIEEGGERNDLLGKMPPGAARNALDCALWDLEAKRSGVPAVAAAGLHRLTPVTTAFTISLGEPAAMAAAAAAATSRPILKVKLGGEGGDLARIEAVRKAAPDATLLADANEGWTAANLGRHLEACAEAGFALIEQPLPAADDAILGTMARPVPICADESLHPGSDLADLVGRYDAVNIKLDKAGGLTAAFRLADEAEEAGLAIMVGCMLGTSLAMAPAMLLTPRARFVDLDGPLLLAQDREPRLGYRDSLVEPPTPQLWG